MAKIYEWNDIKDEFTDGLLLGNGASMAVHPEFHYGSLFEAARVKGSLQNRWQKFSMRSRSTTSS